MLNPNPPIRFQGRIGKNPKPCETGPMESLAIIVMVIFIGLIVISLVTILIAVLARRKKVKFWVAMVFNVFTGLLAAWGISVAWLLGLIPFLGLVISSIILTWPRRKKDSVTLVPDDFD
jgi:hypothetical protein